MYRASTSFIHIASPISTRLKRLVAWYGLDQHMPSVDRAYNKVRQELQEVGLLADGVYLDSVELEVSMMPGLGTVGYVYDEGVGGLSKLCGFREAVIYLPADIPGDSYVPGGTVLNTLRHEYAHAWYALDPEFFAKPWFKKAFGLEYSDYKTTPKELWQKKQKRNRTYQKRLNTCRNRRDRDALEARQIGNDFVSDYAATLAKEDFAETFMTYLKYRKSFERFKSRPGVWKKLRAVEKAIGTASSRNLAV